MPSRNAGAACNGDGMDGGTEGWIGRPEREQERERALPSGNAAGAAGACVQRGWDGMDGGTEG